MFNEKLYLKQKIIFNIGYPTKVSAVNIPSCK